MCGGGGGGGTIFQQQRFERDRWGEREGDYFWKVTDLRELPVPNKPYGFCGGQAT